MLKNLRIRNPPPSPVRPQTRVNGAGILGDSRNGVIFVQLSVQYPLASRDTLGLAKNLHSEALILLGE